MNSFCSSNSLVSIIISSERPIEIINDFDVVAGEMFRIGVEARVEIHCFVASLPYCELFMKPIFPNNIISYQRSLDLSYSCNCSSPGSSLSLYLPHLQGQTNPISNRSTDLISSLSLAPLNRSLTALHKYCPPPLTVCTLSIRRTLSIFALSPSLHSPPFARSLVAQFAFFHPI